ncbi:hypothetical protein BD413DRAFT_70619 [Trametes elegans]|nr:hypothetical protein BD413DRAFT_70619 [Trametes elegans]
MHAGTIGGNHDEPVEAILDRLQSRPDCSSQSSDQLRLIESAMISMTRQVHEGLNARLPVHKLPTELWICIFEEVADHGLLKLRDPKDKSLLARARSLNIITHVCRIWRNRALNAPTLWARIDRCPGHGPRTDAFLLRSRSAPLSLFLAATRQSSLTNTLDTYGPRLHNLYIKASYLSTFVTCDITPGHQFSVPLLQCLILFKERNVDSVEILVSTLFHLHIPRSKALAVHSSCFWWAGRFPYLTHFYLHGDKASISQLLKILATTPVLRYLHIAGTILEHEPSTEQIDDVILESLRALTYLAGDLSPLIRLLARIRIPEQTYIRLAYLTTDMQVSPAHFPPRFLATFDSLDLVSNSLHVTHGPQSGLWWHSETAPGGAAALTPLLLLDRIETLRVYGDEVLALKALLPRLPNLTELGIFAPYMNNLTKYLAFARMVYPAWSVLRGGPGSDSDAAAVCPKLKLLRLESAMPYCWCPEELVEMVKARSDAGVPLKNITIHCSPYHIRYERRGDPGMFGGELVGLEGLVELVMKADTLSGGFPMNRAWEMPEAERYWRLGSVERAAYPDWWSGVD